jgi:hypothetical protein
MYIFKLHITFFLIAFNKILSTMRRTLNEIVPLTQCVYVIGNLFKLYNFINLCLTLF